MATEVKMPKLGLTMVDAKVIEWRKKEGERVEKGEVLLVIETEKVTYEVESPVSGTLAVIGVQVGETVPIGTVLAYILAPGETLAEMLVDQKEEKIPAKPDEASALESAPVAGTVERWKKVEPMPKGKTKISPLARKMAAEHGLDISEITGTGPEGRIVKKDILMAVEEAKGVPVPAETVEEPVVYEALPSKFEIVPLTGMRRTIANRMSQSFQTPHFWTEVQVNATKLKEIRDQLVPLIEKETG